MSEQRAAISSRWEPAFRHAAGRRGSDFLRTLAEDHRLVGWRTDRHGVTVPPIESGSAGEWVEVGPGATLIGYASAGGSTDSDLLCALKLDGADTMTYARLAREHLDELQPGARLMADFAAPRPGGAGLPLFRLAVPSS